MPTGKRASMREGPLAALFRKTSEESGGQAAEEAPPRFQSQSPAVPAGPLSGQNQPPAPRDPASERRQLPHPGFDAPPPAPEQPLRIPSPQERLRHAFSSDIPDNVLERPQAPPVPEPDVPARPDQALDVYARRDPEPDVYARPDRALESFAASRKVGTPVLRVVGVGGAGVNAVNRMVEAEIEGIEFLAINTDLQSLQQSAAHETLHIGESITRGLGSGSNPELGHQAARQEYDRIKALLRGSDMVFIAAGAGGGTGTGAAPVVAQIARELGALTVGIVTRPFQFEGSRRREQSEVGIEALAAEVDTLIVIPNNRLLSVLDRNTSMVDAFRVADDVLRQGVQGISDLVTLPGLINLDFADVRTIMSEAGNALLGIGMGAGEQRALEAAEQAVSSPLLETSMEGARSILLSITGGRDLSLWEVNEAAKAVAEAAHPEANIIFGAMVDEKLEDQVWVTVVATGYGQPRHRRPQEAGPQFGVRSAPQARSAPRERPVADPRHGVRDSREDSRSGGRESEDADSRRGLREPQGEPRVTRGRERQGGPAIELDVPEFMPKR